MLGVDVMALDHPIERFAIDSQETRSRLFVAAGVFEYTRDVTTFDDG